MKLLAILVSLLAPAAASTGAQTLTPRPSHPQQVTLDLVSAAPALPPLTLLDNKARIPVTPTHQPAQLLIALDAINSAPPDLARSIDALQSYLTNAPAPLPQPTSILIVTDTPPGPSDTTTLKPHELYVHRIPPSTDAPTLLRAFRDYQPRLSHILDPQAGPAQSERVRLSLQALSFIAEAETPIPGPKILLWLSPGWPFLASSDSSSSSQLFDSIVYFSSLLRSARILLYSLDPLGLVSRDNSAQTEGFVLATRPGMTGPSSQPSVPTTQDPHFYTNFLTLPRDARHADPNDLSLQVLATQTGGLVIQQNNDLRAALAHCATDAQSVYTVSYTPAPSATGTTQYHTLRITPPAGIFLRLRSAFYTP